MKIRLAFSEIQRDSIVDGEGIRSVIWTQGCPHHCPGCHNFETQDFHGGILIDVDQLKDAIFQLEGQDGITFSGGEPMEQAEACMEIAKYCKDLGYDVWCYTGYTWEELLEKSKYFPKISEFLNYIDVLVDGKFEISQKSFDVKFRGSKNQRLIDVQASLSQYQVVEFGSERDNSIKRGGRKNQYMYI